MGNPGLGLGWTIKARAMNPVFPPECMREPFSMHAPCRIWPSSKQRVTLRLNISRFVYMPTIAWRSGSKLAEEYLMPVYWMNPVALRADVEHTLSSPQSLMKLNTELMATQVSADHKLERVQTRSNFNVRRKTTGESQNAAERVSTLGI